MWRAAVLVSTPRRGRVAGPAISGARVAWGASEEELAAVVDELAAAARDPGALLVITDCDAVHVAAARGVRLEHMPRREAWRQRFPDRDYDRFVARRMRSIAASHEIASLELGDGAPDALRTVAAEEGLGPGR